MVTRTIARGGGAAASAARAAPPAASRASAKKCRLIGCPPLFGQIRPDPGSKVEALSSTTVRGKASLPEQGGSPPQRAKPQTCPGASADGRHGPGPLTPPEGAGRTGRTCAE